MKVVGIRDVIVPPPLRHSKKNAAVSVSVMSKCCVFADCSKDAEFRCSACTKAVYCSEAHQKSDWNSGPHALVCSRVLVGKEIGASATPEFSFETIKRITPTIIRNTYDLTFMSVSPAVLVFRAVVRSKRTAKCLVKIELNNSELPHRNATIGHLLTTLYSVCQDEFSTEIPIIKTYDSAVGRWSYKGFKRMLERSLESTRSDAALRVLFSGRDRDTASLYHFSLMELSGGVTFDQFLREHERNEALVLDVLAQILSTLSDLEARLEFVHHSLDAENIAIKKHSQETVFHYTTNSASVMNVRSLFQAQLAGLGHARLSYNEKVYSSTETRGIERGSPSEYRPWADLHRLAYSIIGHMSKDVFCALAPSSPLLAVLSAMLRMQTLSTMDSIHHDIVAQFVALPRSTADDMRHIRENYDQLMSRIGQARNIVVMAYPGTTETTAYSVIEACSTVFDRYISYRPTSADKVIDMSLYLGGESSATRSAWKAMQKTSQEQ
jgi:MYND finger